jgi:hypothetical protein
MPQQKTPVESAQKHSPSRAKVKPAAQRNQARQAEPDADGYDAESGPLETGFASEDISLERSAILDDDLSVAPEDLGRHALLAAAQQDSNDFDDPVNRQGLADAVDESGSLHAGRRPDIDLTDDVVREGSLFDEPLEDGNLRTPRLKTNEVDASHERDLRAHRAGELATPEHRSSNHRRG